MYHHPTQLGPAYLPPPPPRLYLPASPVPSNQPFNPYAPRTPGMDPSIMYNAAAPPSPTSPPSSTTWQAPGLSSYATSLPPSTSMPSRPYMSPALTHQFDHLSTTSPALGSTAILPTMSNEEPHITVHDISPMEGSQGTQLTIRAFVNFPPTPPPSDDGSPSPPSGRSNHGRALRVVFGNHPVQTQVMVLGGHASTAIGGGQMCQLTANVPSWSLSTGGVAARGNRVAVLIQVLDGSHALVESVHCGEFTYNVAPSSKAYTYTTYAPSLNQPLKRSGESLESHRPSPNQFLHRRVLSTSSGKYDPDLGSYAAPIYHQPSPNPGLTEPPPYSSPYMGSTTSLPSVPAPVPGDYSPQPSLMRSTQVPQSSAGPAAANPYVMSGPAKACLDLQGDLDQMAKGWSQEEWVNRRRLVQFWRRQEGTTITAAFRALPQADYPAAQQSIIISCIFREDKNTCFVTSVDAIYLLEALVGTRFTVEEKNRIRRNLEGFRPITVSKSKPGSEDFFKLIMGFPNPKPRNIEKDVKVFPWDILGPALKKIIGKYSASYQMAANSANVRTVTPSATPMSYSQPTMPAPLPIQDAYANPSVISSGSAPTLASHSSSDSSNYNNDSTSSFQTMPETPQLPHEYPGIAQSPTHYRAPSQATPLDKFGQSAADFVYSPPDPNAPYSHVGGNPYWDAGDGNLGLNNQDFHYDHTAQLPHVHESHSREPSSNDLRIVYPTMPQ